MASILLQHEQDPHAFVVDFAGDSRHLLEYVSDDVLATVSEEMRSFLLRASVLDELSGAACDAVLETFHPDEPGRWASPAAPRAIALVVRRTARTVWRFPRPT